MDSLTHIVLGACIGEAFADKKVGKRAMICGILAQGVPDLDFLLSPLLDPTQDLLVHRGFSHSFLFAAFIIPLFAVLANRFHRPHNIPLSKWIFFFTIAIGSHLFIDAFNNYGIGWLEPFDHRRISFHILYVADPLFTLGPALAAVMLLLTGRTHRLRMIWTRIGLASAVIYLGISCVNKAIIERHMAQELRARNMPTKMHFITPAPFQNLLWFVVSGNDSGFYAGYRSLFDNGPTQLTFYPRNNDILKGYRQRPDIERLLIFSQGFYTVSKTGDSLLFNDLRFGQVVGWMNPAENFSFHYYMDYLDANDLIVQRGRFEKLDIHALNGLRRRMLGKPAVE
jgi:inner membrane protein